MEQGFILTENSFGQNSNEALMCQGNGYMGLRNIFEEEYVGQKPGLFVAGAFDCFDGEVAELPNAPDVIGMTIELDGARFALNELEVLDYCKSLNMKTGISERRATVRLGNGKRLSLVFKRFVSMVHKHLICQQVEILSLDGDCNIKIHTGINGCVSNSGTQHFSEGEKRFLDGIMRGVFTTTESKIDFIFHTQLKMPEECGKPRVFMKRRQICCVSQGIAEKDKPFVFEKRSLVHTSRDLENAILTSVALKDKAVAEMKELEKYSFYDLFELSANALYEKVWKNCDVIIEGEPFSQLAVRFAIYHLAIMAPVHDNRMSIGARGLTSEQYKGHVFWDTEIFCLPFFIYTMPKAARSMLEYRYNTLEKACEKAKAGGYEGAQFPWESAWVEDGEATPDYGPADLITGQPMKVWGALLQHHITADVVYAIQHYFEITNDQEFMESCGYEIIFETAKFWASRLQYNPQKDRYEINDVMGPDEYKLHVNNNAYTNYMADYNMKLALYYRDKSRNEDNDFFENISEKLKKLYLPKPNADGIIPQDDTYLSLMDIDLSRFKNQKSVDEIFEMYNLDMLNGLQVTKQADVAMLLWLLGQQFTIGEAENSLRYYEQRTLHDSSLSLSAYSMTAIKVKALDLAYEFFRKSCEIDLGADSKTDGIHAAASGGIWQCVVLGFGGISRRDGVIHIEPLLPAEWKALEFKLTVDGSIVGVRITHEKVEVTTLKEVVPISFCINGEIISK